MDMKIRLLMQAKGIFTQFQEMPNRFYVHSIQSSEIKMSFFSSRIDVISIFCLNKTQRINESIWNLLGV